MTSVAPAPPQVGGAVVSAYRNRTRPFPDGRTPAGPTWDEMVGGGDALRPEWQVLADSLDELGPDGLLRLTGEIERLVEDDAVSYTPVGGAEAAPARQPWPLDPLPLLIGASEWTKLEAGLVQRSLLLDAVFTDIYRDRKILRNGWVPPEVVFAHPNYLRAAHRVGIPGAHQLFFHAVDLCRGSDGSFQVLGDRTQAPSGAAYAMEGRRIVAKVLPEVFRRTAPRNLGGWFRTVRGALEAVAPDSAGDEPRVVVLSPGTHSETAFDQAYLATLLGLPLVESADLTVRGGRLWMRALGRYEPVDVLVRRVDAAWSDPLDLRPESQLGVVALNEACRRGTVTVVNPLGSGVIENPALLPFLPRLCRELLGEELTLGNVPTLWCGERDSRHRVLADLDELVIKPLDGGPSIIPALLDRAQRDELRARVCAQPEAWVGQQPAPFPDAPAVDGPDVIARRVGFRAFSVAHESGYVVLPGGLGRVVRDSLTPPGFSDRAGSLLVASKDVWVSRVRVDRAVTSTARLDDSAPLVEPVGMAAAASPRVLEDLFWLGRYAERAEDLTRLLIVARELVDTWRFRTQEQSAASVPVLLEAVSTVSATNVLFRPGFDPMLPLRQVLLDAFIPGSVAQSLSGLSEAARSVRDQLSGDTWTVLAAVDRAMVKLAADPDDEGSRMQRTHAAVLSGMLALSGLAGENMVRDPGWYLMDIGRRLERGQQLVALLRATMTQARPADIETILIDAVLSAAESGVTYRRRYRGRIQVGTVLELLIFDAGNPRSLAYQLDTLAGSLHRLPDAAGTSRPERLAEELAVVLRRASATEMDDVDGDGRRRVLADFLDTFHDGLRAVGDAVGTQHFFRSRSMQPLGPLSGPVS